MSFKLATYQNHLGNNRLSYTYDTQNAKVKTLEENHYYPFGLRYQAYTPVFRDIQIHLQEFNEPEIVQIPEDAAVYKYKYNGKELQDELNLNWYDYGARNYDAALGRFPTIDPDTEKYYSQSPYVYADNNPVRLMDINGKGTEDTYKLLKNGEIKKIDNKKYYDKNGKEVDKLVAEKNNKSIFLEKGILATTKIKKVRKRSEKKIYKFQFTETTKSSKGTKLFEFMAKNVTGQKEVAFMNLSNGKSYVYTSFDKGMVLGTSILLKMNKKATIQIHFHSHPNNDPYPSNDWGDTRGVEILKKLGHKNIRNYIYTPGDGKYHFFDENSTHMLDPVIINFN